jgi:hypothetical protein
VQGFELSPESDWPMQYHLAMSQGCTLAAECDDRNAYLIEGALSTCYHAVSAAAAQASKHKKRRQQLEDRYTVMLLLHFCCSLCDCLLTVD